MMHEALKQRGVRAFSSSRWAALSTGDPAGGWKGTAREAGREEGEHGTLKAMERRCFQWRELAFTSLHY